MTPKNLIEDLRTRINPAYITQIGTESYERHACVEALEWQANEISRLRAILNSAADSLDEASLDMADWGQYASEYFQQKHGLDDDVKKYKEMATKLRSLVILPNA